MQTRRNQDAMRTPYEKGWWYLLAALVGCFVIMTLNLTTARTTDAVPMAWFLLTFVVSAVLGVYSLALLRKLPAAMTLAGALQACLFGFNVLGRFLVAWLAKTTGG